MLQQHSVRQLLTKWKLALRNSSQNYTEISQQAYKLNSQEASQISSYMGYIQKTQHQLRTLIKKQKVCPPLLFAYLDKISNKQSIKHSIQILEANYRSQTHRQILIYNIAKLYSYLTENKKAIFWYETLLKEDGERKQLFIYNYAICLVKQERFEQAFVFLQRYMNIKGCCRLLFSQVFLRVLSQRSKNDILYFLGLYFNNNKISLITAYNIGIIMKKLNSKHAKPLFKEIVNKLEGMGTLKTNNVKMLVKVQINLIQIYKKQLKNLGTSPSISQKKTLLETIKQLYKDIDARVNIPPQIQSKISQINQQIYSLDSPQIKKQSNANFIDAIFLGTNKKRISNPNLIKVTNSMILGHSPSIVKQDTLSIQQAEGLKDKIGPISADDKAYAKQRKLNEQKLLFLMNKQKQLNAFFKNVRVFKDKDALNVRFVDPQILEKTCKTEKKRKIPNLQSIEKEFNLKKQQYKLEHKEQELEDLIYELLGQYDSQKAANHKKMKRIREKINVEKIKSFMESLDRNSDEKNINIRLIEPKGKITLTDRCISKENLNSLQTSKNGSKTTTKQDLGSNKSINKSSKFIEIFKKNDQSLYKKFAGKFHTNQKNKSLIKTLNDNSKFEHFLQEGQRLKSLQQFEAAHEVYARMYKIFKENQQKEKILIQIAKNFEKLQFDEQAEKTYKKCTKFNNNAEAFYRLSCLQIKNGSIKQGIENLEKANCIDRNNFKIQIKLVQAYSILEETIDRALSLANSILVRHPDCLEALILTAKIFEKKGRLREALEIGFTLCSLKACPTFYHYVGLLYLQDSNINEAFKFFQLAIQCNPEYIPSLIQLATIISESDSEQAIEILKKTIQLDNRNILSYARLGKIYETITEDYQSALNIYRKCLEIEAHYESYIKIGDCYKKMGKYMDSLIFYNKALNQQKTSEVFEKLGEILQKQKQQRKAIQAYLNSIECLNDSNSSSPIEARKKLLFKVGSLSLNCFEYDAAITNLLEVLEIQESFEIYKLLGHAYFGKGQYKQALNYFKQASALSQQQNLEILENIAMCFDKEEEYLISKEIYEKILQIDNKNIRCLNNLANILLILGKTNQAFYWFEYMLQQIPTNIEKRLRVADIYATIGDWSKVQHHLIICGKQKQNDIRVLQRMVNLYKQKPDTKLMTKFQKKLNFFKQAKTS